MSQTNESGDTPRDADEAAERKPGRIKRRTAPAPKRRTTPVATADAEDVAAEDTDAAEAHVSTGSSTAARPRLQRRSSSSAPVRREAADSDALAPDDADEYRAGSPAKFVKQSADELRKVVWPTGAELGSYFVAVLVFVLFIIAFVGLLDLAFGWSMLKLFGR